MIIIPSGLVKKGKLHYIASNSSKVFHPETEVDQVIGLQDALNSIDALPSQTNNSGKLLTTNGSAASWGSLDSFQQVFNVNSSTTTCTINSANIPTGNLSYSIAVYHDGLRLVKDVDYTYNTSTRVITFNRTFLDNDQVVVYIGALSTVESLDTRTDNIHPSERCITNNATTGSVSLDIDNAVVYSLNITGNTTLSFTKDSTLGIYNTNRSFTVTLLIKNGGNYTITWPSGVHWADSTAPTLSTSDKYDIITLITFDSGITWLGIASGSNYTLS